MIGGATQPTRNTEFPSDFTLQFQSDSLLFYPEPNGHGHQAHAWLDPNEQAHYKYRFILFRSISLDSLKEDEVSSFVHPDQEIEYDLIGYVVGFLAPRKAGGKLLKIKLEVEVEAAPGKLEHLLKKWADDNDRDRKEISDIIWKKAVFGHSIYSR